MDRPIINPSSLTEEQREAIKAEYEFHKFHANLFKNKCGINHIRMDRWHEGRVDELVNLFGKELFNDKEK